MMLNRVKWQFIFALFWFSSVYLAVGALSTWEWGWRCGWINVIIGIVGLLLVTRTEEGDNMFYKGPQEDQDGWIEIALLWTLPFMWLCAGILWGIMRLLGIYNW